MVLLLIDDEYHFDYRLLFCIRLKMNEEVLSMLEDYNSADLCDSSGSTLLHYSAEYGNEAMTKYFINRHFAINATNNNNYSPLMLAVKENSVAIVQILLDGGAEIYEPRGPTTGSLLKEVFSNCTGVPGEDAETSSLSRQNILRRFLRKVAEDFVGDTQGMAKLLLDSECLLHHVICVLENAEVTQYYLKNGYAVDARELENNCTSLHFAVRSENLVIVKLLLEHGADVNARDDDRKNVLFYYDSSEVCSEEKLDILRNLLESKASLDFPNMKGIAPIEYLLDNAQEEVVRLVIQYADPLTKYGYRERTVLHILTDNHSIQDIGVFELLAERYFDVNAKDDKGNTAFDLAMHSIQPERVAFLLREGADISAFNAPKLREIIYYAWQSVDENNACVQILELYLLYGGDFQSKLSIIEDMWTRFRADASSSFAKILITHLTLLEACGHELHPIFCSIVHNTAVFTKLRDDFQIQLMEMKSNVIYESITTFDLVTANDKSLTRYAANDDLMSKLEVLNSDSSYAELYYYKFLKKRMDRAVDTLNYQVKASSVLFKITKVPQNVIIDEILCYLSILDVRSLSFV